MLLMDREERAAINNSTANTSPHNCALRLATAFFKGTKHTLMTFAILPYHRPATKYGLYSSFTFCRDGGHRSPASSSAGPPAFILRLVGCFRIAGGGGGPALHL